MFRNTPAATSFSVSDMAQAKTFYAETLGLEVVDEAMALTLRLGGGGELFLYPKHNHAPATFTVLNFSVSDLDATMTALSEKGIQFEHYPEMKPDEKGVFRGKAMGHGPDIAWFKDPFGNIIAVMES